MRFEPILCDFDGTLADSEPVIVAALQAACDDLDLSPVEGAGLRMCVGPPLERSLPVVLGPDAPVQAVIDAYRRHYMDTAPTGTALMPGALEAIETWTAQGIRMGVVTYKPLPLMERILDGMAIAPYVKVLRAPPIGEPPASKIALLQEALDELQPHGGRPLFIGDHDDDQSAAAEVGIDFIRYPGTSWRDIVQVTAPASPPAPAAQSFFC